MTFQYSSLLAITHTRTHKNTQEEMSMDKKASNVFKKRSIYDQDEDDSSEDDEIFEESPAAAEADVSIDALKQKILGRSLKTSYGDDDTPRKEEATSLEAGIDLRRELSCAICHEILHQPVSLHCGHSFCGACLHWWLDHSVASRSSAPPAETGDFGNCPTCRSALLCHGDMIGVNTALRATVQSCFPKDYEKRLRADKQAEQRATAGEDGGAHDRGYEIISPLEEEPWKTVPMPTNLHVSTRRSIVLDSQDQRMQLALALHGLDCPAMSLDSETLQVSLCLLTMEEDEVDDSGFPMVLKNSDDAHCIVKENRFVSSIEVTAETTSSRSLPVARRLLGEDGIVSFQVETASSEDLKDARTYCFRHEETGTELQLRLPLTRDKDMNVSPSVAMPKRQSKTRVGAHNFLANSNDESEEDEGDHMDEFEEDGFVVGDDDEGSEASHNVCHVCQEGGEMIVCDGGNAADGCGRTFHLNCIERFTIPPGDWICKDCAFEFGIGDVGIKGHEFADQSKQEFQEPPKLEEPSDEDFGEGSFSPTEEQAAFSDEGEDQMNEAPVSKVKRTLVDSEEESPIKVSRPNSKRQRFIESDEDDDD